MLRRAATLSALSAVIVLAALGSSPAVFADDGANAPNLPLRWVYLSMNLQVDENVPKAIGILERAAKLGYNGVLLADYKLNILERVPDRYFRNARAFREAADRLGIEIVPAIGSFGYSSGILAHDPNLAEGIPVRGARFRVVEREGRLEGALVSNLENPLPGGGFEAARGDVFQGWGFQDAPGVGTHRDTRVKRSGEASIRFENTPGANAPDAPNRRVSRRVKVEPFRQYRLSAWIKTADFDRAGEIRMFALGDNGRTLAFSGLGVRPNQDWTEHHVVFNSLDHDEVGIYLGMWSASDAKGAFWVDDATLEETAFVNLVRRRACPLVVRRANSEGVAGAPLVEGRDFEPLADPKLGNVPYAGEYEVWHEPPALVLKPESGLRPGDELVVDFFHTALIYDGQVACSLDAPEVFDILRDQVRRIRDLFEPKRYMMSHDEIRVAGWAVEPGNEGKTPGTLLAENFQRCASIVRELDPDAKICVWSDMFDPHHNAVPGPYYLVNGSWAGSWEGLPKDALIVNWNSGKAEASLRWFADRGHRQILAGYYDANPRAIERWLEAARRVEGVDGVMYTTWVGRYADLEPFAKSAWPEARP